MANIFYDKVKERLLTYASIDTQSDGLSTSTPTTDKQFVLARLLFSELKEIGASEVYLDEKACVVYGKLPANCDGEAIGFVTHLDTAQEASGKAKPWVLENYDGKDIVLNDKENIVMRASEYPNLQNYIGQDLVLTDGTTLLGGDDKAGIASVMTMAEYLLNHPEIKHPLISLAFTPDEEVGGLAKDLDFERFEAKLAYTIDGDYLAYYQDETFNASEARIYFKGRAVHTGTAKDILINAGELACKFMALLPNERPENTEGREGFYHLVSIEGDCEESFMRLIIRDHDDLKFKEREKKVLEVGDKLNEIYKDCCKVEIKETYRNMKEVIDKHPQLITRLVKAIEKSGLEAKTYPFRGGTDGSSLSWRGLPCPNLSAGYENAHGRFEYVPIQSMVKNVEILINLVQLFREGEEK